MKCFSAQLCKKNCQTKIILSAASDSLKLAQNHPLNQAFPGNGTART